jgi:hypothetical protein
LVFIDFVASELLVESMAIPAEVLAEFVIKKPDPLMDALKPPTYVGVELVKSVAMLPVIDP